MPAFHVTNTMYLVGVFLNNFKFTNYFSASIQTGSVVKNVHMCYLNNQNRNTKCETLKKLIQQLKVVKIRYIVKIYR